MNHGKNICNQLKMVRKRIAEENHIPLEIEECTFKGECNGSCPHCEAEVRYLENALADRLRLGKVATVAGLVLGLSSVAQAQAPATDTTDTIAKIQYTPAAQNEDVDAYILRESETRTTRGESGVITTRGIRRRIAQRPPRLMDTKVSKFQEKIGTPARQSISTEPPKMYEESPDTVKIVVR